MTRFLFAGILFFTSLPDHRLGSFEPFLLRSRMTNPRVAKVSYRAETTYETSLGARKNVGAYSTVRLRMLIYRSNEVTMYLDTIFLISMFLIIDVN